MLRARRPTPRPGELRDRRLAAASETKQYSFADYARFLIANPDWPEETASFLGAAGDAAGENLSTVLAFFAKDAPTTGNGYARLADAYAASGRSAEALQAARKAWAESDLSGGDEQAIWARYGIA